MKTFKEILEENTRKHTSESNLLTETEKKLVSIFARELKKIPEEEKEKMLKNASETEGFTPVQ